MSVFPPNGRPERLTREQSRNPNLFWCPETLEEQYEQALADGALATDLVFDKPTCKQMTTALRDAGLLEETA